MRAWLFVLCWPRHSIKEKQSFQHLPEFLVLHFFLFAFLASFLNLQYIYYRFSSLSVNPTQRSNTLNNFSAFADELFECAWPICGAGAWRSKELKLWSKYLSYSALFACLSIILKFSKWLTESQDIPLTLLTLIAQKWSSACLKSLIICFKVFVVYLTIFEVLNINGVIN